jgi:formate hydrogenlyase transcriptional activator
LTFQSKMQEQRPLQFVSPSGLAASEYPDLFDLRDLPITRPNVDTVFTTLALLLRLTLNVDVLTLGLCDPETENVRLRIWMDGKAPRSESVPFRNCASGWVWRTQRSMLIQDLSTEHNVPFSLESLRQFGVRSYYVLPLTTARSRLGSMGFGSSHVVQDKKEKLELLRRMAAIVAPILEVPTPSVGADTDVVEPLPAMTSEILEQHMDDELEGPVNGDEAFPEILGNSAALRRVLKQVRRVAPTDATVLLLGETGTGKELMARAVHRLSPRADKKFITVNCTAIPMELLESELFGYEKGAFTGAINRHIGRLESAHGGTLLLDEIGDLPGAIQPKLLRVLQDKEFERLGSNQTLKIDVRLIAATNQDLHQRVAEARFREDLFYRLNVFPITLPPLRERRSDIPALVRYFVSKYADESKKSITTIPAQAMDALVNWSWRGNVRELQNLIHRCVILSDASVLCLPVEELQNHSILNSGAKSDATQRELILHALKEAGGVMGGSSGAASRLGMKRTTLYSRMKKLNITPDKP